MSLPEHYTIEQQENGDYAVIHEFHGELINDAPFYSTALHFAQDHAADAAEAEGQEAAQYDLPEDLASAVADFLTDLDRHGLSRHMMIGLAEDRCEIASLRSLRKAHAAATARAA